MALLLGYEVLMIPACDRMVCAYDFLIQPPLFPQVLIGWFVLTIDLATPYQTDQ